jgi:hypothetical protein
MIGLEDIAGSKLFDITGDSFFNVLVGRNRQIYLDCLFIIYYNIDSTEDSFQGDKEYIVKKLTHYFDEHDEVDLTDEEIRSVSYRSRMNALQVIKRLTECEWIGQESLGDFNVSLFFYEHSLRVIDLFEKMILNVDTLSATDFYSIYLVLKNFTPEEGVGLIEEVYQKTNEISLKLKTVKANIYRIYARFNKERKNIDMKNVLEDLLKRYQDGFFDKRYYNLLTRDSLTKYGLTIISKVQQIRTDQGLMDFLVNKAMGLKLYPNYSAAYSELENRLLGIERSFVSFSQLMNEINKKNEQYLKVATEKYLFLSNRKANIEGNINSLLERLAAYPEQEFEFSPDIFSLFKFKYLSDNSFYVIRKKPEHLEIDSIEFDYDLAYDELHDGLEKLSLTQESPMPKCEDINRIVDRLMGQADFYDFADFVA